MGPAEECGHVEAGAVCWTIRIHEGSITARQAQASAPAELPIDGAAIGRIALAAQDTWCIRTLRETLKWGYVGFISGMRWHQHDTLKEWAGG